MSHTNQTPNYHLPQFIGTDKPAWLVDFNQSMSDIDTQMKANETASATAEANAQSALSGLTATNAQVGELQTDVTAIQTQLPLDEAQIATNTQNISTQASAIVNANNRIDTANGNITALNTKVGDLTDLDTTDKTSIVNAVNELNADIGELRDYEDLLSAPFAASVGAHALSKNPTGYNKITIIYRYESSSAEYVRDYYPKISQAGSMDCNLGSSGQSVTMFSFSNTGITVSSSLPSNYNGAYVVKVLGWK